MKKGRRQAVNSSNKKRLEEVTRILEELDYIAVEIVKECMRESKQVKKEDIKEMAQQFTEMPIGDLEVSLLWAKLNDFQSKVDERRKQKKEGDNIK